MVRPHPMHTAAFRTEADELHREWVMKHRRGQTQVDIAAEYNVSKQAVSMAIKTAMKRAREELFTEAETYRALNLERLGALLNAVWDDAMLGHDKSVAEARRIIDSISKLTGANEAIRIEIGESDVDRTLRELDQLLNQRARAIEGQVVAGPREAGATEGADG